MQKETTSREKKLTVLLNRITNIKLMLCFAMGEYTFSRTKQPVKYKLLNTQH